MKVTKELSKAQKIILIIAIILLMASLVYLFIIKYRDNHIPTVSYRVYTKEKGWSKWCKNGETCGNDNYITAVQVKVKTLLYGNVIYDVEQNGKWHESKIYENGMTAGNKKNPLQGIRIKLTDDIARKFKVQYRINENNKKWGSWIDGNLEAFYEIRLDGPAPCKYLQVRVQERR